MTRRKRQVDACSSCPPIVPSALSPRASLRASFPLGGLPSLVPFSLFLVPLPLPFPFPSPAVSDVGRDRRLSSKASRSLTISAHFDSRRKYPWGRHTDNHPNVMAGTVRTSDRRLMEVSATDQMRMTEARQSLCRH
jgi:hypothetical protein